MAIRTAIALLLQSRLIGEKKPIFAQVKKNIWIAPSTQPNQTEILISDHRQMVVVGGPILTIAFAHINHRLLLGSECEKQRQETAHFMNQSKSMSRYLK